MPLTYGPNADLDGLKDQDLMVNYATSWGTFLHSAKGVARDVLAPTGTQGATLAGLTAVQTGTVATVAAFEIGWHQPITDSAPTAAHANAGTGSMTDGGAALFGVGYAGVVGFDPDNVTDVVVWSINWTPLTNLTDDPSPTLQDLSGGRVQVTWPNRPPLPNPFSYTQGTAVITATLNGSPLPAGEGIIAVTTNEFYTAVAWGPEP